MPIDEPALDAQPDDPRRRPPTITAYPDGPLLVRGEVTLFDEDGLEIPRRRRTIALCRCGKSGISPLCDGTHKLTGLKFAGSAIRERRRGGDVEAGRAGDEPGASEEP